jgi:predicted membrane-bound spermidine synthase
VSDKPVFAAAPGAATASRSLPLIFTLFFLSGFSALIYQTTWQRLLGLFGGADTVASALVVGAFLLGLGLGSLWASRFADAVSRHRALVLFGLCELGIALFAALSTWIFYDLLFGQLIGLAKSRALVFVTAFVGLLWPTILMGLSLPLLSRAVVRDIANSASEIGWLYAVNTLGAGIGALLAGWWIIGVFGYALAINAGALINLGVGLGALAVAWHGQFDKTAQTTIDTASRDRIPPAVWQWCALVFASGFIIISLQIVWYRLLGLMMQSNAYSFSLILGVFLIGDAVGLIWGATALPRIRDAKAFFLWMQGAVALYSTGIIWLIYLAFGAPAIAETFVDHDVVALTAKHLALICGLTALVVLPGSVLIGFSFPLVQKAVQTDPALVGQRVGLIQLFNIGGNSAGGVVTGLVLLHWFGTSGTLRLIVLAGLGFMVALMLTRGGERKSANMGLAAALLALATIFPGGDAFWSRLHFIRAAESGIVGEDRSGVVFLRQTGPDQGRLHIQGHAQSAIPFLTVHGFLGVIGPLTHPNPKDVLVIGVGSGGTPYSAGVNPATERVRAIEIVEPVYDVLRKFIGAGGRAGVDRLFNDPRFDLRVGDGRLELFTADRRYDVIETDAILPKTAHSGALYSAEFYQQLRANLKPGGIAVQWSPTDRSLATFLQVFPHVVMIHPAMLGSDQPIEVTTEMLVRQLDRPEIAAYLREVGFDIAKLRQWFRDKKLERWGPGDTRRGLDINTDLFPKDEYYLNRRRAVR